MKSNNGLYGNSFRWKDTARGPSEHTEDESDHQTDSTTTSTQVKQYTARLAGLVVFLIVLVGVGIITFHPAAIAASTALLVFLIASVIQTPPRPSTNLTVSYSVTPENPRPSEEVEIEATITNKSSVTFTDLRLIDTVPNELQVIEGSPRAAETLLQGESITLKYTVIARRGSYSFGPVKARSRALMGAMWVQENIPIETNGQFRCAINADDIPLDNRATHYIGGILGESGGEGIEFYSTREYHRGDSPSKINWREFAKRGDLSTITYREPQAAQVTIIPDVRLPSRVSAGNGSPSAALLSIYTAYQLTTTLTAEGNYVGMAIPGMQPSAADRQSGAGFPYRRLNHSRGGEQQEQAFKLIEEVESLVEDSTYNQKAIAPLRDMGDAGFSNGRDPDDVFDVDPYRITIKGFVQKLRKWMSSNAQIIFITPMVDGGAHGLCTHLRDMGYPVVVISPDITKRAVAPVNTDTKVQDSHDIPHKMLELQRAVRIQSLRQEGFTVIDWDQQEPLSACFDRQTLPSSG